MFAYLSLSFGKRTLRFDGTVGPDNNGRKGLDALIIGSGGHTAFIPNSFGTSHHPSDHVHVRTASLLRRWIGGRSERSPTSSEGLGNLAPAEHSGGGIQHHLRASMDVDFRDK